MALQRIANLTQLQHHIPEIITLSTSKPAGVYPAQDLTPTRVTSVACAYYREGDR